ncbi:3'-5' exonuclease [Jannaschia sp. CCS1]|uniref:3'-5' exonuclease n=1 Tax=Jannaschia sp. (strain CCS1) TaxID=290400 RepID=UPI000053BFD4|nr:3'-5' exonuclease [Jannaschia sp. CCS1]ABD53049.1 Exonuclease [Jannaschia sp. CCS1]
MNTFGHLQSVPDGPFRFIAVDVETANNAQGSICQIGLCCVGSDDSLNTVSTLIDPEQSFSPFNTDLHGISAETVNGAPTFPQAYASLYPVLNAHRLVQHSRFDEAAFTAACARYDVPMVTSHWTDSVKIARQAWPELKGAGGHGLASLKKALGLSFHHHDAGEDARASATVILRAEARISKAVAHLRFDPQLAFEF